MSNEEIFSNASILLVAGNDTTTITLEVMIRFLIEFPQYQRLIIEEVDSFNPSEISADNYLHHFKWIRAVMWEALRLSGPTPAIFGKISREDVKLGNYEIPSGTNIVISTTAIHLDRSIWGSDAEEFNPKRFYDHDLRKFDFLLYPFSAGPRACVGKAMAELEITTVISMLLKKYTFTSQHVEKLREQTMMFVRKPANPIMVDLVPRTK